MRTWLGHLGKTAALCLVPASFFYIHSQLFPPPAVHAFYGDPDYGYLLNSLLIVCGLAPAHIDHPGTLLQLLGALVIRLKYFWGHPGGADIVSAVLLAPYEYLRLISEVMIAILAGAALLFGLGLNRLGYSLLVAMIAQSAPLWLPDAWIYSVHVSPEILIPVVGFGVAYLLLRIRCLNHCSNKEAAILGALLGAGLALKMNMLPLLIFVLVPSERRSRLIAIAAVPCAFVVSTIPIWPRYGALFDWLERITTHQATYGTGNAGWFPAVSVLASNFALLIQENPAFFYLLILLPIVAAASHLKRSSDRRLLVCCWVALIVLFSMVMKQVATRYLLPSTAVWAVLVPLIMSQNRYPGRHVLRAITVLILAAAIFTGGKKMVISRYSSLQEERQILDFFRELEPYRDCARIYGAGVPYVEFALHLGNLAAFETFAGRLQELYPDTIFYENFPEQFRSFGQGFSRKKVEEIMGRKKCEIVVARPSLAEHSHTLLLGSTVIQLKESPLPFQLETILIRGQLGLYRIAKFNSKWKGVFDEGI